MNNAFNNLSFEKVLNTSSFYSPVYLHEENKQKLTVGLKSGNYFTKWVLFFHLPLVPNSKYTQELLSRLKDCVFIEYRNVDGFEHEEDWFKQNGFIKYDWLNIIVDTTSKDQVWSSLNETKRRQIRRSLDNQAEISFVNNIDDIHEFYRILKKVYKKRVKKPLPDWKFFKSFHEQNVDQKYGVYILVKYKGKVIAGMMCPLNPGNTLYEWYIAGLDKAYNAVGIYPSTLVTWGALRYAIDRGIPEFNFMGAGRPGIPYGVRDFKMQFGGELIMSTRYLKINKPFLYNLGKLYFKLREKI